MNRKRKPIYYFWAAFALILGILVFIPIVIALVTSLKPQTEVFSMRLLPKEPTFAGYVEIFTEFNFGRNIKNSDTYTYF